MCGAEVLSMTGFAAYTTLLPQLQREWGLSNSEAGAISGFLFAGYMVSVPVLTSLTDRMDSRRIYFAACLIGSIGAAVFAMFGQGFWTAAFAQFLIGAALGGTYMPGLKALTDHLEGPAQSRATAFYTASFGVGSTISILVAGKIRDTLDWHWAFWINVPIGLLAVVLSWLVVPRSELPKRRESFDWRGAVLLAPSLTAVVAVLNQGHAWGYASPAMIACAVAAVVLLALFVGAERRSPAPLLDLGLLAKPVFLLGNLASFLSYAGLFGVFFLVPFVMVRVYDDSSLQAGLRLSVLPVALALVSPVGGALYDRFGARLPAVGGLAICLAGLVLLYRALDGSPSHLVLVLAALALFGAGQGLFISPNNSAIMAAAPAEETGQAAAVLNLMRLLGISAGIAGGATVLSASLDPVRGSTLSVPPAMMIEGGRHVIVMLGGLVIAAGLLSLVRPAPLKGD